jgi:P27 family predicted phage terminase small subunit
MPRGRKPKPTVFHKLQGTYNVTYHRKRAQELKAAGALFELSPPEWFDSDQHEVWQRVLRDSPAGVLARLDWQVLANYCELVVRHKRAVLAQRARDAQGGPLHLVETANGGLAVSPHIHIINSCVRQLLSLQSELGLTPASRARLSTPQAPEPDPALDSINRLRNGVDADVVDFARVRSARRQSVARKPKRSVAPPIEDQSA